MTLTAERSTSDTVLHPAVELPRQADGLLGLLRSNAARTEADCQVVQENIVALAAGDPFHISIPERLGGHEADSERWSRCRPHWAEVRIERVDRDVDQIAGMHGSGGYNTVADDVFVRRTAFSPLPPRSNGLARPNICDPPSRTTAA